MSLFEPKGASVNWATVRAFPIRSVLAEEDGDRIEELEDMYDMLVKCTPTSRGTSKEDLIQLFQLTQALLELKAGDVEEIRQEMEQVKSVQAAGTSGLGDEGASQHQLAQVRMELRHKTETLEGLEREVDDLRQGLQEANANAATYETERDFLQKKVARLTEELSSRELRTSTTEELQTDLKRQLGLKQVEVQQLGDQLAQDQERMQALEKQVKELTERLQDSSKEMTVASEQMSALHLELRSMENQLDQAVQARDVALGRLEVLTLQIQSSDAVDMQILTQVDETVQQWKLALGEKDAEVAAAKEVITRLQEELQIQQQLAKKSHDPEAQDIVNRSRVAERVEATSQATEKEIDEEASARLTAEDAIVAGLREKAQRERIGKLEEQLLLAQRQVSELQVQVNQYEQHYGIKEAVADLKAAQTRISEVDAKLTEATKELNVRYRELDSCMDENQILRERLGISYVSPIEVERVRARRAEERNQLAAQVERLQGRIAFMESATEVEGQGEVSHHHTLNVQVSRLESRAKELEDEVKALTKAKAGLEAHLSQEVERNRDAQANLNTLRAERAQLSSEAQHLVAALRQLAQNLNTVQYKVTTDGSLAEYSIQCDEVSRLLMFYDNHAHASKQPSGTLSDRGEHGSDAASLKGTASALGGMAHITGLSSELASLYQSDLMHLKGANSQLRSMVDSLQSKAVEQSATIEKQRSEVEKLTAELTSLQAAYRKLEEGSPLTLPADVTSSAKSVIAAMNRQMLQVLHDQDLSQQQALTVRTTLTNVQRMYQVLIKQKGLLYEQFKTERRTWQEAQERMEKELADARELAANAKAWQQQLYEITEEVQGDTEDRTALLSLARKLARSRINEEALKRRLLLFTAAEARYQHQVTTTQADLAQCEAAAETRIDALNTRVAQLQAELARVINNSEEMVPRADFEQVQRRSETIAARHRALLQKHKLLQMELAAQKDAVIQLREAEHKASLFQRELQLVEDKIQRNADSAQSSDPRDASVLKSRLEDETKRAELLELQRDQAQDTIKRQEEHMATLNKKVDDLVEETISLREMEAELLHKLQATVSTQEYESLKKSQTDLKQALATTQAELESAKKIADIAATQAESLRRLNTGHEKELQALRTQLTELQVESDDRTHLGRLHHKLLAAQMAESNALRRLEQEHKRNMELNKHVLQLQTALFEKQRDIIEHAQHARSRNAHLRATVDALRSQYAGAVTLRQQTAESLAMEQVLDNKSRLEKEVALAAKQREEAMVELDQLRVQHEHVRELLGALGSGETGALSQLKDWQQRLGAVRLHALQLQRKVHELEAGLESKTKLLESSERMQRQLEHEAVEMAARYEEQERLWSEREAHLEASLDEAFKTNIAAHEKRQRQTQLKPGDEGFFALQQLLPDGEWPVGEQLQHCVSSLHAVVEQLNDLRAKVDGLTTQLSEKEAELSSVQARLHAQEAAVAQGGRGKASQRGVSGQTAGGNDSDDNDDGDDGAGAGGESLQYRYDRIVEAAQQTIGSLQQLLDAKDRANDGLQVKLAQNENQITVLNAEIEKERALHSQQVADLEEQTKQQLIALAESDSSEGVVANLVRRLDAASKESKRYHAQSDALRKQLLQLQAQLTEIQEEFVTDVQILEQELDEVNAALQESQAALAESRSAHARVSEELVQEQQRHHQHTVEAQAKVNQLDASLRESQTQLDVADDRIQQLSQTRSYKVTLARLEDKLKQKTEEADSLSRRVAQLEAESPRNAPPEDTTMAQSISRRVAAQERELAKTKAALKSATEASARFERQVKDLEQQLLDASKDCEVALGEARSAQALSAKFERDAKRKVSDLEAARSKAELLEKRMSAMQGDANSLRERLKEAETRLKELKTQTADGSAATGRAGSERHSSVAGQRTLTQPSSKVWEADKKLVKRLDTVKAKLAACEAELVDKNKAIDGHRATIERLQRDKTGMQKKLRVLEASIGTVTANATAELEAKCHALQSDNEALKQRLSQMSGDTEAELEANEKEELLQLRCVVIEQRQRLDELQQESVQRGVNVTTQENLIELEAKVQNLTTENQKLKQRLKKLESGSSRSEVLGDPRRALAVAQSELDRYKLLNRQLTEERDKQVKRAERALATCDNLSRQSDDLKQQLDTNEHLLESGNRLLGEKEQIIQDHETAIVSLKQTIAELREQVASAIQGAHVRTEQLSGSGDGNAPQSELLSQLHELQSENAKLREELSAFDLTFFEEIEQLKADYEAAQMKLYQYEHEGRA
eukprot:m.345706 g.345706  ORF g.345706 m.345706 type:complete len:2261 (-) comp16141_c1_seq15:3907-10689(-)